MRDTAALCGKGIAAEKRVMMIPGKKKSRFPAGSQANSLREAAFSVGADADISSRNKSFILIAKFGIDFRLAKGYTKGNRCMWNALEQVSESSASDRADGAQKRSARHNPSYKRRRQDRFPSPETTVTPNEVSLCRHAAHFWFRAGLHKKDIGGCYATG